MTKKKHYLVYKTTCLLNGKIYIGQHQTYNLNDGYIGSGTKLNSDIRKFGRENFHFQVLYDFDTQKEMDDKERELVTEEFVKRKDTYNLVPGGSDGISSVSPESRARANRTRWKKLTKEQRKYYVAAAHIATKNRNWTIESKKKLSDSLKKVFKNHPERNGMFGKCHSSSSKIKMRNSHLGKKNNQYGKMWICNDLTYESKTIFKTEPIPDGWRKGRFCKNVAI